MEGGGWALLYSLVSNALLWVSLVVCISCTVKQQNLVTTKDNVGFTT
jgi:hypothetical protein